MLTEIFQYLRNWFEKTKYFGEFVISGNTISYSDGSSLPLIEGQYFRIVGSLLNDGVYKHGDADLQDEDFEGSVWSMAVPPAVVQIITDISNWVDANAEAISSPYQSESFGGYSYTKAYSGSSSGSGGVPVSWQTQFAVRLSPWRKI